MSEPSHDAGARKPDPLERLAALDPDLVIPPKVFEEMGTEFIDYEEGVMLRARFPVQERYENPMRYMQGGMIVAAIDNTMGPLSYLAAPPSVTTQLNTSFVRPVGPHDAYIEVEARVVERVGKQLLMTARVTNPGGHLVATAHATCVIVARGLRERMRGAQEGR